MPSVEDLWATRQLDASPIPVSMRIAITEAESSRPLGRSPPQVGILRLLEKSERLRG